MLTRIEKVIFLKDIAEFAEIPTEQLSHIASITEEIEHPPHTVLIRQDEPAEALYFIIEGKVNLEQDGRKRGEFGKNEAFGFWSLLDDEQSNIATAVTVEPTRLLRIGREDFFEIVADYVEITQGILKSLARRLRKLVSADS